MVLREAITDGERIFLISHIRHLYDMSGEMVEEGKSMTVQPIADMVGADTALGRLMRRCPEYDLLDVAALAGRKVSRVIWQTVMDHRLADALSIWVPAVWTFEALLCRLFLQEVKQGTIILGPDEKDARTIAQTAKERLPRDFAEGVLLRHESELARPIFLNPDPDLYPHVGPRGATIH
ncbi:MAG: hypothetical protein AAB805_00635 [Patescibacteria group bacterium]